MKPIRHTVDLSGYPDLVVIYLGLRVNALRGIGTLMRIGRGIGPAIDPRPDGLLAHEAMFYSLRHVGFRQYWRDIDTMLAFTRSEPHRGWWSNFLRDSGGTGFWHETYRIGGGMEAVYVGLPDQIGFQTFAPARDPSGPFQTARGRLENGA